ncbi:MAG: HEAT repeat domain-containing protein [Elusimicrobia bacterium]|nr:HEAT repeat domain-containing protein [Candidatus Liberimonas magnetica]
MKNKHKFNFPAIFALLSIALLVLLSAGFVFSEKNEEYTVILECKKILEAKKLNRSILRTEQDMQVLYKQLGEEVYEMIQNAPQGAVGAMNGKIEGRLARISACNNTLREMKSRLAQLPRSMSEKAAFYQATANLSNKDINIKAEAVRFLGETSNKEALPYLAQLAKDPDVGNFAAEAIMNIVSVNYKPQAAPQQCAGSARQDQRAAVHVNKPVDTVDRRSTSGKPSVSDESDTPAPGQTREEEVRSESN